MVNDINKELVKNHEISGIILCNDSNQVVGVNKTKGNADSVYTPNNVINFHTHPISAYNNGKTVWGWPSGEDIRETIKFALAGNKAHLVFSVEGLYTIQVSPCKIRKIKELLDDRERGILIFIIEEYFKTTHNFRGVDDVNKLATKNIFINPYSYVDFVNTFDLVNLLNAKKFVHTSVLTEHTKNIGHTGIHGENNIEKYSFGDSTFSRIPNIGFPDINGHKIENQCLKDYIKKEDLKEIRKISTKGDEDSVKIKDINEVIDKLHKIFEDFDSKQCEIAWNNHKNAWFFVNFFPSNNYREHDYIRNNIFITPVKNIPVTTDVQPFIRIFSNKKEGCTVNQIGQANKFKIGKMTTMGHCTNCGFGKNGKNGKNKSVNYKGTMRFSLKTLKKDLRAVSGKKSVRRRTRFGNENNDQLNKKFENLLDATENLSEHNNTELSKKIKNIDDLFIMYAKLTNSDQETFFFKNEQNKIRFLKLWQRYSEFEQLLYEKHQTYFGNAIGNTNDDCRDAKNKYPELRKKFENNQKLVKQINLFENNNPDYSPILAAKEGGKGLGKDLPLFTKFVENKIGNPLYITKDFTIFLNAQAPYKEAYNNDDKHLAGMSFVHLLVIPTKRIYNAVTLKNSDIPLLQSMRLGASSFIQKPENRKEIVKRIENILSKNKNKTIMDNKFNKHATAFINDNLFNINDFEFYFHPHPCHSVGHLHMHALLSGKTHEYRTNYDHDDKSVSVKTVIDYLNKK